MSGTMLLVFLLAAALVVAIKLGLIKKRGGGEGAEHGPVPPKNVLMPIKRALVAIAALWRSPPTPPTATRSRTRT